MFMYTSRQREVRVRRFAPLYFFGEEQQARRNRCSDDSFRIAAGFLIIRLGLLAFNSRNGLLIGLYLAMVPLGFWYLYKRQTARTAQMERALAFSLQLHSDALESFQQQLTRVSVLASSVPAPILCITLLLCPGPRRGLAGGCSN